MMDDMYMEVEHDVANVVNEVARLWPDLKIQICVDPSFSDPPYRVVEMCKDGVWRPVLNVWQLDNRLLDLLHNCDSYKVDILSQLDTHNTQVRRAQEEAERTWREAAKDVMAAVFKSPKGTYTIPDERPGHEGETIKIDDDPARRTIVPDYSESVHELDTDAD
jgi:hypothetical protein